MAGEGFVERLRCAVDLLRSEQLADAEVAFAGLLAEAPEHPECLHFAGILHHVQGRSDEGLAMMRRALDIAPRSAIFWNNLGNVLQQCQRHDEASMAYEKSIEVAEGAEAADGLLNLAGIRLRQGRLDAAEGLLRQSLALRPDFAEAWYGLSQVLIAQGRLHEGLLAHGKAVLLLPESSVGREEVVRALVVLGENERAGEVLRQWQAEAPDNPLLHHLLAACTGQAVPERASDAYLSEVFDAFAPSFDDKLAALGYRTPERIAQALRAAVGESRAALDMADLGCGTGLVGPLVRPWARRLVGCDLSVGMLRQARRRGCYDKLHKAELVYYMDTQPGSFDVLTCADTFVYFGPLEAAFTAAARCLRAGGWLLFSVESLPEDSAPGHRLAANGRYAHSRRYIEQALRASGLAPRQAAPFVARQEAGEPVHSWMVSAQRLETAPPKFAVG
jgi:predicted TPR repeat methyltransferase